MVRWLTAAVGPGDIASLLSGRYRNRRPSNERTKMVNFDAYRAFNTDIFDVSHAIRGTRIHLGSINSYFTKLVVRKTLFMQSHM